jgi:uncharacterized protein YndB with AHSA1/START domain
MTAQPAELHLDRIVSAPVAAVWEAWTTKTGLKRWWWSHWADVEIELDPVVGGRYRFAAPHAGIEVSGTYVVIRETEHLAFTWRWEDADGVQEGEVVDVRFTSVPEGTRLRLSHRGPWETSTAAEDYRQGWTFVLNSLESTLSADAVPGNR